MVFLYCPGMSPRRVEASVDPEHARVGATCKALREKTGLKLGEAANALVISYSYLSNIESGRKALTPVLLARMAELYDVPQIAIRQPDLLEPVA